MDLNDVFLVIYSSLNLLALFLVFWGIYEFSKLDMEQFRYYVIGLSVLSLSVFGIFARYILFPPLSDFESVFFGYLTNIPPLFGIAFFLKGTHYLAKRDRPDFKLSEDLYLTAMVFIVITIAYQLVYTLFLFISEDIYDILAIFASIIYLATVLVSLATFLQYRDAFTDLLAK